MSGPERNPIYHISEDVAPASPKCAVCGHLLLMVPLFGRTAVMHSRQPEDDHAPEPVSRATSDEEGVVFVCDFCSGTPVTWSYPATAFDLKGQGVGSADDWAACDPCHDLIEADDWETIMLRYVANSNPPISDQPERIQQQAMASIRRMHAEFRRHRMGPPERYTPGEANAGT